MEQDGMQLRMLRFRFLIFLQTPHSFVMMKGNEDDGDLEDEYRPAAT